MLLKSVLQGAEKDETPLVAKDSNRPYTSGGFGIVEFKPFKVPTSANARGSSRTKKRPRVVYAENGFGDDVRDEGEAWDPNADNEGGGPSSKKSKKGKKKDDEDSDDDGKKKSRFGGMGDNYKPPPPPKKFAVFRPKPTDETLGTTFKLPQIRRKGVFLDVKQTGQVLGTRRPVQIFPRPLHNPLEQSAIVLYDPTIDALEQQQLAIAAAAEASSTSALTPADVERKQYHKTLAEILGLVDPKLAKAQAPKVAVVIDPRVGKVLRPHQLEGVKFLYKCVTGVTDPDYHGCIMADEMGLGKTLQCISLLWTLLKQSPTPNKPLIDKAIVVCPSALVANWAAELVKWLGEGAINPLALDGKKSTLETAPLVRNWVASKGRSVVTPVIICSYEKLRLLTEDLGQTEVGLLLCDEGHRLKNSENQTYLALNTINCKRRVVLTGTPVQNDLDEYFSLLNFANPGFLGTKADFHKRFELAIRQGRDGSATDKQQKAGDEKLKELNGLVAKFMIRRTNDLLTKYLPVKYEHVVFCGLSPFQNAVYEEFINSPLTKAILKGKESKPLAAITMLRKLVNHPDLVDWDKDMPTMKELWPDTYDPRDKRRVLDPELSGKMAVLDRWLVKLKKETDDKIVLISNYTTTLDLFEKLCRARGLKHLRLDGASGSARSKLVPRFNNPDSDERVFLLSSKAGGCGLNLIGANRLILFDPDWNPASDMQALARVWRDGQKKNCFVYRFVATGTVEEKIFQRQSHKQSLSSCVVDEKENVERLYSGDQLRQLFLMNKSPCETHDLFKCKRCKDRKQFVGSPAMLYGDTSTWNHLTNDCLSKIHDDFLRSESGLDTVTACFQYIST